LRFDRGDIKDVASRGQQKLVAAALVIAQTRLFEDSTGLEGVLLVDDAAAELDSEALGRLLTEIEVLRSQLVFTGLEHGALNIQHSFPVFHVEQGKVRSVL
jgi:DNA replication and repair protein RecF